MADRTDVATRARGFGEVSEAERAARWSVWRVRGVGYRRMARLVDETRGDIAGLFEMPEASMRRVLEGAGFSERLCERLAERLVDGDPVVEFADELDRLTPKTRIYHLAEPGYPRRLLDLADPPVFVYVRGDLSWLEHLATVAIVGSRKASVGDGRLARSVAKELGQAGVVVVSGGALGIDACAHKGCLDAQMPTVAVLAGGVDQPSPRRNAAIFERAVEHGALVSEYPHGVQPRTYHFQRRNALIAALGDATVVVRAGEKSGTLITAQAARDIGRPLCAIPGPLDDPLSAGCHKLLVEGAQCVRGAADVLEHVLGRRLGPVEHRQQPLFEPEGDEDSPSRVPPQRCAPVSLDVSEPAREMLRELRQLVEGSRDNCVRVDPLKRCVDLPPQRVDALLLELELAGAIAKKPGANAFVL